MDAVLRFGMKNWKKIFCTGTCLVILFSLLGCQEKVITVADIQEEEGQPVGYIEMQEFEIKEKEAESGREEVQYCAVMIPAGYQESEEIPGMYLHERSPLDSSNVYYTVAEGDSGLVSDALTSNEYKDTIEQAFKERGKEITLEVESFEEIDMDGVPGYKIRSVYEVEENKIEQLTYMILAENTYTITYSQSEDDELMADFEISDGEIKLVKEENVEMASVSNP